MAADLIVFLAEDDLDDQQMLIEMMREQHQGIEFQTAGTGSKAFDMLRNAPRESMPCLVILDYNLPEISGAELLERMKEMPQYANCIRVVWSTSNSPVYRKRCLELQAHSYIVKPTDMAGFRSIAASLIGLCTKGK